MPAEPSENFSIRHLPDLNLVLIRIWGKLQQVEFMLDYTPLIMKTYTELPGPATPDRLFDFRDLELDFTTTQVIEMADWSRELNKPLQPSKSAFLVSTDLMFGQIRQYEIFSQESHITRYVFRDLDEALEWLEIDPEKAVEYGLS